MQYRSIYIENISKSEKQCFQPQYQNIALILDFTNDVRLTPGEEGSAESGRSIVIRVWFYYFIRTQGGGGLEILVLAGRPFWMASKRYKEAR